MTRFHLAVAISACLLSAGSAHAFQRWCVCPPQYYYSPPVVFYPTPLPSTIWGCAPVMTPAEAPKDRVLPKPMPEAPPPKATGKDEKAKGGVAPAEFRDAPKAPSELATPKPAPPPELKGDDRVVGPDAAVPSPAPPPTGDKKVSPMVPSPAADLPIPRVEIVPAKSEVPKGETTIPVVEPGKVPAPANDFTIPKIEVTPAKADIPKLEASGPAAVEPGKIPPLPVPASPAKKDDSPKIPMIPTGETSAGGLQIPPIDIPAPTAPAPAVPPVEKKSTSGSSPLANVPAGPSVSVSTVAGLPTVTGRYSVRFFNYTDSAFQLKVEDGSIILPAKHFVDVQVGRSFTWKAGSRTERTAEIPADAAGLEIAVKP